MTQSSKGPHNVGQIERRAVCREPLQPGENRSEQIRCRTVQGRTSPRRFCDTLRRNVVLVIVRYEKSPTAFQGSKKSGHGVTQPSTSVRNLCEIRGTTVHDEPNTADVNCVKQSRIGTIQGSKSPRRIANRPRRTFGYEPISSILNRGQQCRRSAIIKRGQRPGRIRNGLWCTMFDQPHTPLFHRSQQCGKGCPVFTTADAASAQFRTGPQDRDNRLWFFTMKDQSPGVCFDRRQDFFWR